MYVYKLDISSKYGASQFLRFSPFLPIYKVNILVWVLAISTKIFRLSLLLNLLASSLIPSNLL